MLIILEEAYEKGPAAIKLFFKSKWLWFSIFTLTFLIQVLAFFQPELLSALDGPRADILMSILGGLAFLGLGGFLEFENAEKIHRAEVVLNEQKQLLDFERTKTRLENFVRTEDHYNFCIPELDRIDYEIAPVRDDAGKPKVHNWASTDYYVVHIRGKAYEDVLSERRVAAYEGSPIKEGEYYFLVNRGDKLYLSETPLGDDTFEVEFSSRMYEAGYAESANQLMGTSQLTAGLTRVCAFLVGEDGARSNQGSAICVFRKEDGRNYVLTINESPPKSIFLKNRPGLEAATFRIHIDSIGGYFWGAALETFKQTLAEQLAVADIELPRITWADR